MRLADAARQGIARLRLSYWADPRDYMRLDVVAGGCGPWGHLYTQLGETIGAPSPQSVLLIGPKGLSDEWVPYDGPLHAADSSNPASLTSEASQPGAAP